MFPGWFDPRGQFNDDDDMAQSRRGPGRMPPRGGPGGPWRGGPHDRPGSGGPGPRGPGWGPGFGGPGWNEMRNLRDAFGNMFGRARARRGNVRSAILTLLAEKPHNGYQIMQAIEQRSNGQWKPSSGSIYPTLQLLEDEGLVEAEETKPGQTGSKSYKLSAKGKRYVDDNKAELEAEWAPASEDSGGGDPRWELMNLFRQVAGAAMQVAQSGTPKQIDDAKALLNDVRRNLYRILADLPSAGDDEE
jgi:DNA-binding PadR family transcriptional regulator